MSPIYLVGFMGSGKSTIGKELAKKFRMDFYDLDEEIEKETKCSIPEIFEKEGEEGFRSYESQTLKKFSSKPSIVATGGGIVEKQENRDFMKENGVVVYLHTEFETIDVRLKDDQQRPLWRKSEQEKKTLYNRRLQLYADCAHKKISTDSYSPYEVVDQISRIMKEEDWLK